MGIVKIRLSGDRADLEATIRFLLDTEATVRFPQLLSKSIYYPNRNEKAVRCYLDFLIESDPEVVAQEVTLVKPELPPENSDR